MVKELRNAPYSEEAEKAVLSAMLLDHKAITTAVMNLKEQSFYIDKHRYLFNAILSIFNENNTVEFLSVINQLDKDKNLEIVSKEYLLEVGNYVQTSANISYYVNIVKEKEQYRQLINICTDLVSQAYDENEEVNTLLDRAESEIFQLAETGQTRGYMHIKSVLNRVMEKLEMLHERKSDLTGVETGYPEMNKLLSGWQKSDLVIIAGRPAMGKTAFVLNIARNAAYSFMNEKPVEGKEDKFKMKGVAVFSLEMGMDQLVQRLITSEAMIDGGKIRTGSLQEQDWVKLATAVGKLFEMPIYIDDSPGLTLLELRAKARRLKAEKNIELIIIDYLQLMEVDGLENRQQEISKISRNLKLLAKELDVPILALSQLSRALESRNDKRPQLSDLRESGSIEQDADIVMFVHRPEYYRIEQFDDGSSTENKAEIIVGKHRNGPVGDVRLEFIKNYGRFVEIDQVHYVEPSHGSNSNDPGF
jgi:replicative DNA helicase